MRTRTIWETSCVSGLSTPPPPIVVFWIIKGTHCDDQFWTLKMGTEIVWGQDDSGDQQRMKERGLISTSICMFDPCGRRELRTLATCSALTPCRPLLSWMPHTYTTVKEGKREV